MAGLCFQPGCCCLPTCLSQQQHKRQIQPSRSLAWALLLQPRLLPEGLCQQQDGNEEAHGEMSLTDPKTERAPGRGMAGMCCSISAEERRAMEQLQVLIGTLQPGAGMILDCSATSPWINTQCVSFCSTCSICCTRICGSSKGHPPTSSGVVSPEKSFGTLLLIPKLLWGITGLIRSQSC